ncbi:MAG: transcription-repair coupling factor [Spirochaetales bacterium]|nr:transcription-repair coupling factor [Spirochaetales bacterium]
MLNQFKSSVDRALAGLPGWKSLRKEWTEGRFPLEASGARGPWSALVLSKLAEVTGGPLLVVTGDEAEARALASDLEIFAPKVAHFPWWGTMLYRGVSPQAAVFGKRASILADLASGERFIVVTSLRAALGLLPSPQSIQKRLIELKVGGAIDPVEIESRLERFGYTRVPRVSVPGEFALRGEVLDVAPLGEKEALRIAFAWDEVDEIRTFDPLTQASTGNVDHAVLHPLREVVWDDESISCLEEHLPEGNYDEVLEALKTGREWRGEELFYPLASGGTYTLQDYLGQRSVTVFSGAERLRTGEKGMQKEHAELYAKALEGQLAVPSPELITTSLTLFREARLRRMDLLDLRKEEGPEPHELASESGRSFFGNIAYMKDEFATLTASGYTIYVFAESESQSQRIEYLLRDNEGVQVGPASLSEGFHLPRNKILVVQENEIFGRRKRAPASVTKAKSAAIDSFVDLNPGDLVVHINHGIGRFEGIKRIKVAGAERDYITLRYADEETIFIPLEQVNLVQRYIGNDGRIPRLDRIGGPSWEKKKNKVKKSVADLADRLVKLYARRQTAQGYSFPKDDDFQISFEAAFPWQETDDQLAAISEVKGDMESHQPMDRLVCGDVGYGKTEIAMRAAFKAVMGGRQVAYLCPTTILAEQHHESFTERFKRFPVTVGMLSRFVTPAERKRTIAGLEKGDIDVVIGTHRILSKDVKFKNLGLVIIDEEQRFGVKDKERLKEIKASVDCLTLSATPIPRTLHMSLLKIRDMSLLKTAPSNRQPIETFIQEFDPELVAKAIRREVDRGGQVFFLHNRVESLERIQHFLRDLVPEVFVEIAHGQMTARQLEDIMHRFIHGAFQVLVSTTIIENGIDIPNVNTIIIDRADMYGISQLYQLRGRVGRSGRLAYAYMLYPEGREISELAMKRLQVISDFTELGSGFKIAMKDLEVRGAGNLLGAQQSGDVSAVGFDLYIRLLEEAIRERTQDDGEEVFEPYLELDYSGFIPVSYISEESEKMEVYKKIAAVATDDDLSRLHNELHDRFGPMPDEVHSLLSLCEIRILCRRLKVSHLKERRGKVQLTFAKVSAISVDKVMSLMASSGGRVKLDPARPDGLLMETGNVGLKEKSEFLRERLEQLV